MKIETVFFRLSNPASNNPSAGIINNTKLPAIRIHAVSPESIGTVEPQVFYYLVLRQNFINDYHLIIQSIIYEIRKKIFYCVMNLKST
jgi:hypothetical protein